MFHPTSVRKTSVFRPYEGCTKYIIDVDTGCDDAQFLVLAIHLAKKLNKEIIGITCVDGNAELKDVVINTLITLKICDVKIKVYKGAKANIQGYVAKDNYFGKDGLNNQQAKYEAMLGPDDWAMVQEETAYDFISKSANKHKKNLGMIFTAPLTNLAIAYLINNEIPNLIGGLTIMGGSYSGVGMNHAFSAEFNFHGDVDAAYLVIKNFKNITLIPIELAFEAPSEEYKFLQLFNVTNSHKGRFIKDIFDGMTPMLCDPYSAFTMFVPDAITSVYNVYGEVCREGPRTKGFLALDWLRSKENNDPNLQIVCEMNWKMVYDVIQESVQ